MASQRSKKAATLFLENRGKSVSEAMRGAGYSEAYSKNPQQLTATKGWNELLDQYLSEPDLLETHKQLMNSHSLEHMVLGVGPKKTEDLTENDGKISDEQILLMLSDANCVVRKIVHGPQARHIYYFCPDNRARKDALDMGYKLRGKYAAEKHLNINLNEEMPSDKIQELASGLLGQQTKWNQSKTIPRKK